MKTKKLEGKLAKAKKKLAKAESKVSKIQSKLSKANTRDAEKSVPIVLTERTVPAGKAPNPSPAKMPASASEPGKAKVNKPVKTGKNEAAKKSAVKPAAPDAGARRRSAGARKIK